VASRLTTFYGVKGPMKRYRQGRDQRTEPPQSIHAELERLPGGSKARRFTKNFKASGWICASHVTKRILCTGSSMNCCWWSLRWKTRCSSTKSSPTIAACRVRVGIRLDRPQNRRLASIMAIPNVGLGTGRQPYPNGTHRGGIMTNLRFKV